MNTTQLLEEILSRQIPFMIVEGMLLIPPGSAEDLELHVERLSTQLAQSLLADFQAKPQQKRKRSRRFNRALPKSYNSNSVSV